MGPELDKPWFELRLDHVRPLRLRPDRRDQEELLRVLPLHPLQGEVSGIGEMSPATLMPPSRTRWT